MTRPPARRIRVFVTDDHPVVRDGLRGYLMRCPEIEVVGDASSAEATVEQCRTLVPDVVLMDQTLPAMSGIEALPHLGAVSPNTRVILLTMQDDREYVREARRAGAGGYLLKDVSPSELVQAITVVHASGGFYTSGTSRALLEELDRELKRPASSPEAQLLSPREEQVLRLVAAGLASRAIADRLGIGLRTVEAHRLRLRKKLGIRSVAELTQYAIAHGLQKDPAR